MIRVVSEFRGSDLSEFMFVDRVQIHVQAGKGGDGCLSFRREKYVPKGGPDGGDGGSGGSISIRAVTGVNHLSALAHRKHWKAKSGSNGQGSDCHGRSAADVVIEVPPGTIIMDADEKMVIKDLSADGESVVVAHGGRGGKGNAHFKTSTNRGPRKITKGQEAESRTLILELKLIADVGLIGKPNAGKSTLLARLTRARPEIANYPFTTKRPNLGLVEVNINRSYVLADIPGLIEGAHAGAGLGHEFLRPVERTKVLVHLVEPEPMDVTDPLKNYQAIHNELRQYQAKLADRPEIIVISKAELPGSEQVQACLSESLGVEVLAISAVTGQGLDKLQQVVLQGLDKVPV
ncbi:MAG: GTPase ObgE [Planctomycetales bacterium]